MRGRRERRYLTEKYQAKQVRVAYETSYSRPYDPNRYIRTEFAKKRRFWDVLCGNYVVWKDRWSMGDALGNEHKFSKAELGRLRKHSWSNCGCKRCCYCCNPRRGRNWESHTERVTLPELRAEQHLKEEVDFYKNQQLSRYTT